MNIRPDLDHLTRGEMKARTISQLDQIVAIHLDVEADLLAFNRKHTHSPVVIPPRPAWLIHLIREKGGPSHE